ncbi:MAG: cell envelope protein SmpA [Rubritepida sp.]|nr:cell envelope protein SmpA [Rubritepida sp.]
MARHPASVNIRNRVLAAVLLTGPALAGCAYLPPMPERPRNVFSTPIVNRGNAVSDEQLAQLTPGVSTRSDVQTLLGSPSQSGTFSDDVWYYISGQTQLRPAQNLALRDQHVVAVNFNQQGTLTEVRKIDGADMPRVDFVSRETPTPGNERSMLQALFGNIGRFGPGALPGGAGGGNTVPVAGQGANTGRQ